MKENEEVKKMKTKYIGIESIFVNKRNDFSTSIACNIMLEGQQYNEPIYTNIFMHYVHLRHFLKLDNSELTQKIRNKLEFEVTSTNVDVVEFHLPKYVNNELEWKFPANVFLIEANFDDIEIQCYYVDINEIKSRINNDKN